MFLHHDHYRVTSLISRGSFGTIYRAIRLDDFKIIAIKRLAITEETDPLINLEVNALVHLSGHGHGHPMIAQLHETFIEDGHVYLVMDYIVWPELNLVANYDHHQTRSLLIEIVTGLVYLHSMDVVHRDIKPENLLYDRLLNRLKIIDFGFAQIGCRAFNPVGTPSYAAPEMLTSNANTVCTMEDGQACDLYSMAIIVYELVTKDLFTVTMPYHRRQIKAMIACNREGVNPERLQNPSKLLINLMLGSPFEQLVRTNSQGNYRLRWTAIQTLDYLRDLEL